MRWRPARKSPAPPVRRRARLAAILLGVLANLTPAPAEAGDPTGTWMTGHRDAKIRVAPCGPALCGTIAWLAQPNDSAGRPATDVNNPDPAKRGRPLIGLTILTEMKKSGEEWRGRIYNSDDGKDYDLEMALVDERRATIKGCVLGGLLCGGETWTRE
jgi:uncharacterized protein (DUF2147 family)